MKTTRAVVVAVAICSAFLTIAVGLLAHEKVVAESRHLPAQIEVRASAPRELGVAVQRTPLSINDRVRLASVDCYGDGVRARRTEKLPLAKGRRAQYRLAILLEEGARTIHCTEAEPPAGATGLPESPFANSTDSLLLVDPGAIDAKYPVIAGLCMALATVLAMLPERLGRRNRHGEPVPNRLGVPPDLFDGR